MACEKITGDGIGKFLGTESVARDLERMSRAVWRKSDVEKGVNFWGFSELKFALKLCSGWTVTMLTSLVSTTRPLVSV